MHCQSRVASQGKLSVRRGGDTPPRADGDTRPRAGRDAIGASVILERQLVNGHSISV